MPQLRSVAQIISEFSLSSEEFTTKFNSYRFSLGVSGRSNGWNDDLDEYARSIGALSEDEIELGRVDLERAILNRVIVRCVSDKRAGDSSGAKSQSPSSDTGKADPLAIIGGKIDKEDGELVLKAYRRLPNGEVLVAVYGLENIILGSALDLAGGRSEDDVSSDLLKKGVPQKELHNLKLLAYSYLGKHRDEFEKILEYIKLNGAGLDETSPGWRYMSFDGKVNLIKAHEAAGAQPVSPSQQVPDSPGDDSLGIVILVSVIIMVISLLALLIQ